MPIYGTSVFVARICNGHVRQFDLTVYEFSDVQDIGAESHLDFEHVALRFDAEFELQCLMMVSLFHGFKGLRVIQSQQGVICF
jgi:hypothetical protein